MKTFITLFGILVFSISASAQDGKVYEYLTMIKDHYDLYISIGSGSYEKLNIKSDIDDKRYDISEVNRQISLHEAEGWEFVSAEPFSISSGQYPGTLLYQVIMRRPKE